MLKSRIVNGANISFNAIRKIDIFFLNLQYIFKNNIRDESGSCSFTLEYCLSKTATFWGNALYNDYILLTVVTRNLNCIMCYK